MSNVTRNCENVSTLLPLLYSDADKSPDRVSNLRRELLYRIIDSHGIDAKIASGIDWSCKEIATNSWAKSSGLVADLTKAWIVAFPDTGPLAIRSIPTAYIGGVGEGVAIAFLEMYDRNPTDENLIDAIFGKFNDGSFIDSFTSSTTSEYGRGRLTAGINTLASHAWTHTTNSPCGQKLQGYIVQTLSRWEDVLCTRADTNNPVVDNHWRYSPPEQNCFLEFFADELAKSFLRTSPLAVKFELLANFLSTRPALMIPLKVGK